MWSAWLGLTVGSVLFVMLVRILNGWRPGDYGRPRIGGWSSVLGGVGMIGVGLIRITGSFGEMGYVAPFGLVLVAAVLWPMSKPARRGSRR